MSRQGTAFGCLFWGTGENNGRVVILGKMGKGEVRKKVASKSHAAFWMRSDYSCRYQGWRLTGRSTGFGLAELRVDKIKLQVKRFEVFTVLLSILPKQLGA